MKKCIAITIFLVFCMIQVVSATCCQINQNCSIIETCQTGSCGTCTLTLYNQTGAFNQSGLMGTISPTVYRINLSTPLENFGTYPYTINCSSGNTCVSGDCNLQIKQMCEEINMDPIGMIIFIPICLAFVYLFAAWMLKGKAFWALSTALILAALLEFFRAYSYAMITVAKYYNWPIMQNSLGLAISNYGTMYFLIIAYFLLHIIAVVTIGILQKRKKSKDPYYANQYGEGEENG